VKITRKAFLFSSLVLESSLKGIVSPIRKEGMIAVRMFSM